MTSSSAPGPHPPVTPVDLAQLVDELEERVETAPDGEDHSREDAQEDVTADVPGAPEPPD